MKDGIVFGCNDRAVAAPGAAPRPTMFGRKGICMPKQFQRRAFGGRTPIAIACAAAAAFCVAPRAHAQIATATIRGNITTQGDSPQPAANASVVATNAATGFVVRSTSNAGGAYVLQALIPGTYRLVVTAPGSQPTGQTITVHIGQNISLNLTLEAQPEVTLDTVVVTGVRDNRNSEVGTSVSPRQIDTLPQLNRNFLNFADIAPGVAVTTNADGETRLRGGAQGTSAINVFIDGVGQKQYVIQGGITGQDTSRGNPFPQSAISEYKVITQNYKAEYDQVSSAAVTAVTKSGTNEFHGEIFGDYSADDWRAATPAEKTAGAKTPSKDQQYGVSLGGPILVNKAHWFVAYERKTLDSPQTVAPGQGFTAAQLPAQYRGLLGAVGVPFTEDLLFGKIDWSIDDANLVELSVKVRREDEQTNIRDQNSAPWGSVKKTDETRADLRWQHSQDNWVNDMHLTYEDASFSPRAINSEPGAVLTTSDQNQLVLNAGGGRDFQDKKQNGYAWQNDTTYTGLEWSGSHVFKVGGKVKLIDLDAREQSPVNPQYYYDVTQPNSPAYRVDFGAPLSGVGDGTASSRNTQIGLYAQDDWELNKNLTLNLGLRWDYERSPSYLNYRTPADVVTALRATPGINQPNAGFNINDYISTGSNRKSYTGAWQPRLGLSFDLDADQQHVVYGGYGRAYDRNLFDYLQLERTKGTFASYTNYFDTPGHPCTANCLDPSYYDPALLPALANGTGAGREIDLLNNELKTPHSDQFSVGMRNRVGAWNTDIGYSHVESRDGFVFLLGNRLPNGNFFVTDASWGPPYNAPVAGFGSLLLGTNGLRTRSDALLFKLEKPYARDSGWGTTLAYTFTKAEENREFDQHYALDYPNLDSYGWKQAGSVSRHRIVATGTLDAPYEFVFSARITLATPTPRYGVNCLADTGDNTQCKVDQLKPGGDRAFIGPAIWGYRQLDMAMTKEFKVPGGILRLRGDLINVFNTMNYDGYNTGWSTNGVPNPTFGTPTGSLAGPTRTFKLGLAYAW